MCGIWSGVESGEGCMCVCVGGGGSSYSRLMLAVKMYASCEYGTHSNRDELAKERAKQESVCWVVVGRGRGGMNTAFS